MNIVITRPAKNDETELESLFTEVILDAFKQDGIESRHKAIQEEVDKQMNFFRQDIHTHGADVFFFIARTEGKIVGTIACSKASELLKQHLDADLEYVPEITTVYVLPQFQGKGIGSMLLKKMLAHLNEKGFKEACLDGGYRKSQGYWIKKIGHPDVTLKDYWGKDLHHMMWHRKLEDLQNA